MIINVTTGPATLSWPHLAELEARLPRRDR